MKAHLAPSYVDPTFIRNVHVDVQDVTRKFESAKICFLDSDCILEESESKHSSENYRVAEIAALVFSTYRVS